MVHTIEVVAPHFRLQLFTQNRKVTFKLQNVDQEIHEISLAKVAKGPYTDFFGKNATTITMPRDGSGRLECSISFNPPPGTVSRKSLWDYLGYKLVVRHAEISLWALRQDTYTWKMSELESSHLDITAHIPSRMIVQLDAPLSLNKNESYVTVPIRAVYSTRPTDKLSADSLINIFMAPRQTYLQAGSYVAGEFYESEDDPIPGLTYKLP